MCGEIVPRAARIMSWSRARNERDGAQRTIAISSPAMRGA
jgi:hypothetical protein